MRSFDALVVGGGPAGATAALLLARAGRSVAVVERATFPRRKVCGEFISATTWPVLERLGVAAELLSIAGPPVHRVGVFAGVRRITAALPEIRPRVEFSTEGRAVGREHLDALLLRRAGAAGAAIWQPWTLEEWDAHPDGCRCTIAERGTGRTETIEAKVVVAAHGAWEPGVLPTQRLRAPAADNDLLGFKAHFTGAVLPPDLMPLIAFAGGYGGMVHADHGRLSLSCCIRRDALASLRRRRPGSGAGDALLDAIGASCCGVADTLSSATREGAWLAAGPLHTGIRTFGMGRIVAIGNAAAEAHPIVAEGISMAIQSAQLLCDELLAQKAPERLDEPAIAAIRSRYAGAWRRNFARRLHVAAAYAHLFMRPATAALATQTLRLVPGLLTLGAQWSGKDAPLRIAMHTRAGLG